MEEKQNKKKKRVKRVRKVRRKGKPTRLRIFGIVVLVLAGIVLLLAAAGLVLTSMGKSSLYKKTETNTPNLGQTSEGPTEVQSELEEGVVLYKGKKYRYNDENLNFLCLGIDLEDLDETAERFGGGGQADTIFLLSLDTRNQRMRILAIPRDTITEIEVYKADGEFLGTSKEQLSTQYSYGDGKEQSCELMVRAVSNLLYQLPIHGYCAIDMRAIGPLNRTVDSVEVTIEEDMTAADPAFQKGAKIRLTDRQAMEFVRARSSLGQNGTQRLMRQKQFVLAYINQAKAAMKKDMSFPVKVYQELSSYLVTDLELDEITYLASQALNASFTMDDMMMLEGESVQEFGYDAYHVTEDVLLNLIIDQFYEEEKEETQ